VLIVRGDTWEEAYLNCAGYTYAGLLSATGGYTALPTPPQWFICFNL
jgi:hypothetical protein